jgi:hypothetical protein
MHVGHTSLSGHHTSTGRENVVLVLVVVVVLAIGQTTAQSTGPVRVEGGGEEPT